MIAFDESAQQLTPDEGVQLMLEFQAGNTRALEMLADLYSPLISAIAIKMTGSQEMVEDITQEVLLRVVTSSERYHPRSKFSTWVALITRNFIYNLLRDRRARRTFAVDFGQGATADGQSVVPIDLSRECCPMACMIARETAEQVRGALTNLIPRQRRAVELVYFQGLSYAQAADRLGVSPFALKALLSRARAQLRRTLRECYN